MTCKFSVQRLSHTALNSGRSLYQVECQRHGLLHPGSTSVTSWINAHLATGAVWSERPTEISFAEAFERGRAAEAKAAVLRVEADGLLNAFCRELQAFVSEFVVKISWWSPLRGRISIHSWTLWYFDRKAGGFPIVVRDDLGNVCIDASCIEQLHDGLMELVAAPETHCRLKQFQEKASSSVGDDE